MTHRGVEAQDGRVEVEGGRIWYRVVGPDRGVPLLVLHGGPGFPSDYLEPLRALADERPVVFYDQLGCGRSDRPDDDRLWRVERYVDELARVRSALRLERVHLFGHSWGSMLATDYLLTRPVGVVSAILASPALSMPRWIADLAVYRRALPPETQAIMARHESAGTLDAKEYELAAAEFYRRHLCRLPVWPESLRRAFDGLGARVYQTMWGREEFAVTGVLADYDRTARLAEIGVPSLFTCGRFDEATPAATAWYASLVPDSRVAVFEHSSHLPHLEEPDAYLQAVRSFLRSADDHS